MNRKIFAIIAVISILLIIATSITLYLLSFHTVTFAFKKDKVEVSVYSADDKEKKVKLADIKENGGSLRLQEGNYAAIPNGSDYNSTPIYFSVSKNDSTVTIDPSYSDEYLASLLPGELPAIKKVIEARFGATLDNFDLADGKLYKEGQWYATSLTQKSPGPGSQGDVYRTILYKKDGTWTLLSKPVIVATKFDFPDVPMDILQAINRLGE